MDEQTLTQEFLFWPDLIRVVATILVVIVHVSGQLTNLWGKIPSAQWRIANIYGGIGRICVPLFFMISGYLLLPRSESLRNFFSKRMTKILIPLIAWSLIYWNWYCGMHPGICTPDLMQELLLEHGTYYHLWFLYSLISIYFILPVLRLMIRPDTDRRILWYLIGLWLVFQPGFTIARQFFDLKINMSAPLATGFVCFFILGYLLGELTLSRRIIIVSAFVWFLSTLATIAGTYLMTRQSGQFDGFFYDFTTFNVILASASAFLLLKWISTVNIFASPQLHDFIRWLASGAFGIYLIHVLIIEVLQNVLHLDSLIGDALWSIPLVSGTVFVLSFLIVRLLQKIPVLRQIVP
jgi:surface polysaccharide O-acyltransferase-like enzyme